MGGLTGVDAVSCVQAMISRPIVAGPIAGLLVGDPGAGMWIGALLEIVSLSQLPIGAARSWETGPATVAAVSLASGGFAGPIMLLIAVAYGVVLAWLGGWTVHALRHLNSRLVAGAGRDSYSPAGLVFRHFAALGVDFARAAVFTLVAVAAAGLVAFETDEAATIYAAIVLLIVASLSIGVDLRMMARSRRTWAAFAAGALLSGLVTLWLR